MKKFIVFLALICSLFSIYAFEIEKPKIIKEENPKIENSLDIYLNIAISIMKNEIKKPNPNKYLNIFETKENEWCTEFVIWSLKEADKKLNTNYVGTLYPLLDSGYKASIWFSENNRLHLEEEYIPKRGDMMFFKYYEDLVDHTAFVTDVKERDNTIYIYTIEGNIPILEDKGIKERVIKIDDEYIYGYGSFEL